MNVKLITLNLGSLLVSHVFGLFTSEIYHFQFCNPETAFYQTNVNKFCVIALFRQNAQDIKTFCKQMVVLDQKLLTTKYLSYGIWIVVTDKPLTFTIVSHMNLRSVTLKLHHHLA